MRYASIAEFPAYRVGTDGSVWSLGINPNHPRDEWFRLATSPDKDGYRKVILCGAGGTRRHARVNVLVLEAFRGPCPPGHLSAHKDGDPANNRLGNLRWATQKANLADRRRHGTLLQGERHPSAKLTAEAVLDIRASMAAKTATVRELMGRHTISRAAVYAVNKRRVWKHI